MLVSELGESKKDISPAGQKANTNSPRAPNPPRPHPHAGSSLQASGVSHPSVFSDSLLGASSPLSLFHLDLPHQNSKRGNDSTSQSPHRFTTLNDRQTSASYLRGSGKRKPRIWKLSWLMPPCLNSCGEHVYLRLWEHAQAETWKTCSVGRRRTLGRSISPGYSGLVFRRQLLRVSEKFLGTAFLSLISFWAKEDFPPRSDERGAAGRSRKKGRTLDPCTRLLILNGLLVWRCLISKHRFDEVGFAALWAGCQAKNLDNGPIIEKVAFLQAQNVQVTDLREVRAGMITILGPLGKLFSFLCIWTLIPVASPSLVHGIPIWELQDPHKSSDEKPVSEPGCGKMHPQGLCRGLCDPQRKCSLSEGMRVGVYLHFTAQCSS